LIEKFNSLSANSALSRGKPKESKETGELIRSETVKGRVLRIVDQRTAVVLINGKEYTARTGVLLKTGDILDLKVKELIPVPVLKTLGIEYAGPDLPDLPVMLSVLDENLWESVHETVNPGKYSGAGKAAGERLSEAFENLRSMNLTGSNEGRDIFIPLPVRQPDGHFMVFQLRLRLPRRDSETSEKNSGDKQPFRISLLVELTELGPVRADFSVNEKKVDGTFHAATGKTRKVIEDEVPRFIESLNAQGLSVNCIECVHKCPDEIKRPLILEMVQFSENSIDTVA
jgi:hypothetical protein